MRNLVVVMGCLFVTLLNHTSPAVSDHKNENKIRIVEDKLHLKRDENSRPADATSLIDEVDIVLPKIRGLENKQLEEKINGHLTLENLYQRSLTEIKDEFMNGDGTVESASYIVNYMDEQLLDIEVLMETIAFYPDTHSAHRCINLKTGQLAKFVDIFKDNDMVSLVDLIKKKKKAIEAQDAKRFSIEDLDSYNRILERSPPYTLKDLDNFEITNKSVKFLYKYTASHAEQALVPAAGFEISFDELQHYLKPTGLLGKLVRKL